MEKQRISNHKISHTILCMIFSILFIFTALFISKPISAYAEDDSGSSRANRSAGSDGSGGIGGNWNLQ